MSDNAEILRAVETLLKHNVPTGTPSTPYTHGPGGLFGVAGIERDIFHTRLGGSGLAWRLPFVPTVLTDPLFGYITGFTDPDESNPEGPCDYPPAAGTKKTCLQTAPFGRYSYKTRELEINRVGQLINRGEFDDLRVVNDPIVPELGGALFPSMTGDAKIAAGQEVLQRFLELGVKFVNKLGRQIYIGTPANNTAGGYAEFTGLDILIGTNKVDAITGTDCPSLYSDIKNFNYAKVDAAANDPDIVETLTTMYRFVKHTAEYTGLMPVKWVLVMRRTLFWEITDVWPCRYLTYRCQSWRDTGGLDPVGSFDSAEAIRMRDAMRNGRYLTIDGENVEVVIDDFIVEESSNDTNKIDVGCYASDIYLVPLTVMGGTQVTFWQHYDYRAGTMPTVTAGNLTSDFWTDNGIYMWHKLPPLMWCVVWAAKIEPRIILRTPHIAARLTNIQYCPLQHTRDVHPDDDYFVDGGVTDRLPPSLYDDYYESTTR